MPLVDVLERLTIHNLQQGNQDHQWLQLAQRYRQLLNDRTLGAAVPESKQQMLFLQMVWLTPQEQHLLQAVSVAGEAFSAPAWGDAVLRHAR